MVLLSQGIPLILSGDEWCNTQKGNNNPYCQDNEVGWTDWSAMGSNKKYTEFVKEIISFRKAHKILHTEKQLFIVKFDGRLFSYVKPYYAAVNLGCGHK